MPSVEAVDRIKNVINSLANEQAILQERGGAIEDVLPPESQPDDDLMDLLGSDLSGADDVTTMDSLLSSLEEDSSEEDDFDIGLDDLEPEADGGLPDLDLDDLGLEADGGLEDPELGVDVQEVDEELEPTDIPGLDEDLDDGIGELGELEDLENLDDGLESLDDDLGELDDLSDLGDLNEELTGEDLDAEPDDIPDAEEALSALSESLEEDEAGDQDEIFLDDDLGLNEIEDDFLDDLSDDEDDQFSLDDLGAEYNFSDDDNSLSAELGLDLDELEKNVDQAVEDESGSHFEMTQDDLDRLEALLHYLPLNLKLTIQNFLANEDTPVEQVNKTIDLLLNESPAKTVASQYRKFTGKKVEIPKGYEKKSAEEFHREKESLYSYVKEKVLPRIGLGLGGFAVLWLLVIIIFNLVYRPIKAESLYSEGEDQIAMDLYDQGEEYFEEAFFGWEIGSFNVQGVPNKERFYSYAQVYEERRKYDRAEEKYQQLLQAYPQEIRGQVAYARLLSDKMARYKDAEYILKSADPLMLTEAAAGLIPYDEIPLKEITEINDIDTLILLGDNYLTWAGEESEMYDKARYVYATLLKDKTGGNTDAVLLRMLRYLIKTDNEEEVDRLRLVYKEKDKVGAPDRLQAEVFSELAGWLIDKGRVMESREFILKAEDADRTVPGTHYQYARFFGETYNYEGEKDALINALGFIDLMDVLDKDHLFMKIDSFRRLGNLSLYVGDYAKAEEQYNLALDTYENSHRLNLIGSSPEIGALYGEMGNLNYDWYGNYEKALEYYTLAEENFGDTPDNRYKKGVIYYRELEDYRQALLEFYRVSRYYPENRNLLLAMGNTLLQRGDYYGAASHYEQLLTQLKTEEENIKVLLPDEKEEEWALIEYMIMTYNNLGIAQDGIAGKTPDRAMRNRALSSFTASSEYFDKLLRNRDTYEKTDLNDLAGQNRQALLDEAGTAGLTPYGKIQAHLEDIPTYYR